MAGDLYDVLGLKRDAGLSDIRAAYRSQALTLHPNRGGDPKAFEELQEAYAVLSNPQRRQQYDSDTSPQRPLAPPQAARQPKLAFKPFQARQEEPRLPPALGEPAGGDGADPIPVPEAFDSPVAHVIVTERSGLRSLQMVSTFPIIEDSKLRPGEVLVAMRAVPLSRADLNLEHVFQTGEFFGLQGVGQVVLVGPQVRSLQRGDWVLPLLEVDEDGDLAEDAPPPGTGRALATFPASRCARLALPPKTELSASQLGLAKSLAAAHKMVEDYTQRLEEGDSVVVNCANGVVGQILVQLLTLLRFQVFAVMRDNADAREEMDLARRRLLDYGAAKVLFDDDDIRFGIESAKASLPQLAFDGVGGDSTARLASSLSKSGDIVCYGIAGGSKKQVLPSGWGKKWKGSVIQFNFDEWIQQDLKANSKKFSELIAEASKLIRMGRLQLDVEEYSTQDFGRALKEMMRPCRSNPVVLLFPRHDAEGSSGLAVEVSQSQVASGPRRSGPVGGKGTPLPPAPEEIATMGQPAKMSWDLDFLEWEEEDEPELEKCVAAEGNLFKPDPVMDELRIMPYVDDALASPVALELGAGKGEATQVLFWLPGAGEVPEEHGPWLNRLSASHPGLRVLILRPRVGFKWFEMSDAEAVKLGLRFLVLDDLDANLTGNLEGDPTKASGQLAFPQLKLPEIEALQQIEGASLGLARRAVIEEKEMESTLAASGNASRLPFLFGGFGQGGTIALYAAVCLMKVPIAGVVFSHSGVPAAGMLGKRLSPSARRRTRLCGVYDKADKEVPADFPEALHHMLSILGCRVSLEWLSEGDGHDFFDDAAARVTQCFNQCLEAPAEEGGPETFAEEASAAARFGGFFGKQDLVSQGPLSIDNPLREKWRQSVQRRGGTVSDLVLRGSAVQVA